MNIVRENVDNLNAVLKVTIEKADYEKSVDDQIKDYRRKATLPGFRPGKVPASLIKKKFGTGILVEEVNKLLSRNLSTYLIDEKLNILGEPLPNEELQKSINWNTDENFEFAFDIALAPEINLSIDKESTFDYYNITITDEMVDEQLDNIKNQMGQNVPDDEVKDNSSVRGNFVELDENGEPLEEGIKAENVLLAVDKIKEEDIKAQFIGKKKDDVLVFDPVKAFDNRHEVGHMLNISHEQADELNSIFKFSITEILKFEPAELNEELFKKLFGDETGIKTIDDLKSKIREDIKSQLAKSSDYKFTLDLRDKLVEQTNPELPEAFLKRWLAEANKEVTAEQIENEFDNFIADLKWQLIKDTIVKNNDLKVTPEEVSAFGKIMAQAQFSQYGMHNVPEEQLDSFAKMILDKPEERERIYKKLQENKVVELVKEKATLTNKEIDHKEFNEMVK